MRARCDQNQDHAIGVLTESGEGKKDYGRPVGAGRPLVTDG